MKAECSGMAPDTGAGVEGVFCGQHPDLLLKGRLQVAEVSVR